MFRFVTAMMAIVIACSIPGIGMPVTVRCGNIQVTVQANGAYAVNVKNPAWNFGGNVGEPLSEIKSRDGHDSIGDYREIGFKYPEGGKRQGTIRVYQNRPVVLFGVKYLEAAKNQKPFPNLTEYPRGLHHLTYNGQFGVYSFENFGSDSPWIFFDSAANAFVLSPASHFLAANTAWGEKQSIVAGIDPSIAEIPQGFEQSTMLVIAKGINTSFDMWGHAMTDLQRKTRPTNDADIVLKYLGYWTDNGATYYYKFDPALGYAGTMLAVRDDFRKQGIPLGYLQLDSWFYPKGPEADWQDKSRGIYEYKADAALFPSGLKAFQVQLGLPLVTHARWIDSSSPYHAEYKMSGNVVLDPRYWDKTTFDLSDAKVETYEQDWLDKNAEPELNLEDPEVYLDNMANACARRKMTMQYCMPLPRHYLQTSKYGDLTTIRTSGDRFERQKWDAFIYDSRLASALGVWPWCDVFMSGETPNLIISTLSAGPVGVGDAIGSLNKQNLMRVVRGDGVIVKPDAPLVPVDQTFLRDAAGSGGPMIAATSTNYGELHAGYVFAYPRGKDRRIMFDLRELGFTGSVYVFNSLTGQGRTVTSGEFEEELTGDYGYYIVVPVGKSGIGFLGDEGQIITLGKTRIPTVTDDGRVHVAMTFSKGEAARTVFGYSPTAPIVKALDGSAKLTTYDVASHLFHVEVSPGVDGMARIVIGR
jgi:hypothetical protein